MQGFCSSDEESNKRYGSVRGDGATKRRNLSGFTAIIPRNCSSDQTPGAKKKEDS
jgi:hypothetical protein